MKRFSAVTSEREYKRVLKLVRAGAAKSMADFVRMAVEEYARKAGSAGLLCFRDVPLEQARREVEGYLRTHTGVVWPDEMAEELGIDYRVVLRVVKELMEGGRVEEAELKEVVKA